MIMTTTEEDRHISLFTEYEHLKEIKHQMIILQRHQTIKTENITALEGWITSTEENNDQMDTVLNEHDQETLKIQSSQHQPGRFKDEF